MLVKRRLCNPGIFHPKSEHPADICPERKFVNDGVFVFVPRNLSFGLRHCFHLLQTDQFLFVCIAVTMLTSDVNNYEQILYKSDPVLHQHQSISNQYEMGYFKQLQSGHSVILYNWCFILYHIIVSLCFSWKHQNTVCLLVINQIESVEWSDFMLSDNVTQKMMSG